MSDTQKACPLCAPRPDDSPGWLKVAQLSVSTLYLERNQTYRGHCMLMYDPGHVTGLEKLEPAEYERVMADLGRAARAIAAAVQPDHMNYASMGNVVPHLHWHIVPRYRSDPRWGLAIWTEDPAKMPVTRLAEAQYQELAALIRGKLERRSA
jgi:diadenosine tetraphosphate (Ap4A) HIT family hydrolase